MNKWDVLRGKGAGIRLRVNQETSRAHALGLKVLEKRWGTGPKESNKNDKMSSKGKLNASG